MLQPDSLWTGPNGTGDGNRHASALSASHLLLPRGTEGYAEQARKRERALGWVLWLGFAAVLVLCSL